MVTKNKHFKGFDNVLCCMKWSNRSQVFQMWTTGHKRPSVLVSNDSSIGLSNVSIAYINGSLTCSFNRINSLPNVTNYADLNSNNYYVLMAEGATSSLGLLFVCMRLSLE